MEVRHLKRDAAKVHAAIDYDSNEHVMIAKGPIQVYVPASFYNGRLGTIDARYNTMAYLAYVVGDSFAISMAPAQIPLTPDTVNNVKINGTPYMVLEWEAGSTICPNTRLVQRGPLVFEIYDEVVAKGKMPWYLNYRDRADLFKYVEKFAGVSLGGSRTLLSIFASSCARNPENRSQPIREIFNTQADYLELEIDYIPLRSVAYGADNTASRFMGSYLKTGVTSSLVNPSDSTESIEELLRI